jgi:GNAT superfamily N-acetyltransferase
MDDGRPVQQALGDGLTLRCAADEDDLEQVAAFNGAIHGRDAEALTLRLFRCYPGCDLQDLIFVEERDAEAGAAAWSPRSASSRGRCATGWSPLPVGEMGIVGTLEEYRRRGLIRAQVRHFNRRLDERGCLISAIQGIPYFYRQFGYEYALPLEAAVQLELRDVPPAERSDFVFRLATEDDLPTLLRLHNEVAAALSISAQRDESTWRYLLRHSAGTSTECERWLISDPHGEPVGYVGVARYPVFGQEMLNVSEVSRLGHAAALETLRFLKELALERGKVALRLNLPEDCALNAVARALGGHDQGAYAWQIRFPAPAALLQALEPLLEQRLACSSFAA